MGVWRTWSRQCGRAVTTCTAPSLITADLAPADGQGFRHPESEKNKNVF